MNDDYAMDTAARFGEIPYVEFTTNLVTGVFDSLVEAHIRQMEEFASFVNSLTQDLSTYINDTVDNVSFDQISDFVSNYELPEVSDAVLTTILGQLEAPPTESADPTDSTAPPIPARPDLATPGGTWWGGLINVLAPVVSALVDKIDGPSEQPSEQPGLNALNEYNEAILSGATAVIPKYTEIVNAVASLITSNKYGLLQTIAKQGAMRLVVTEGEIETKLTFSTWNNKSSSYSSGKSVENKNKFKSKTKRSFGIFGLFRKKSKRITKNRIITINTAKSYQRDSSGTRVNIFGRVLIRFKTDYAPLAG